MEANEAGTNLPGDGPSPEVPSRSNPTPRPYVLNPHAAILKYWEKPLYNVATVPPLQLSEELKERHRIFALLLFALMRRFFNGNKNGSRGSYPWREKQREDDGRYAGSDYLGHNIGAIAVDATGEVIDFDFNHNQIFGSSAEHAEARLIRRVFSLTQLYDGWDTHAPGDPARPRGYSTLLGGVTVYTSLESCAQCSGVMALGQVGQVVYLQRDPGTYHIGNILWNLTSHEIAMGEATEVKASAPRPIPGSEIDFGYFEELNTKYRDYYNQVKDKPFHIVEGGRSECSTALTCFLCTDEAFDIFDRARKEFFALSGGGLRYPEFRPVGRPQPMTNQEALGRAAQFYNYGSAMGHRGTPHNL
jgi:tRNA(Arg) A34 adenosine deaminase TadA